MLTDKKKVLHISKELGQHSKNWSAYRDGCGSLVVSESLEQVKLVALAWAKNNNITKVVVHHTGSNAEVIYSAV
jgi:hypothetical protein